MDYLNLEHSTCDIEMKIQFHLSATSDLSYRLLKTWALIVLMEKAKSDECNHEIRLKIINLCIRYKKELQLFIYNILKSRKFYSLRDDTINCMNNIYIQDGEFNFHIAVLYTFISRLDKKMRKINNPLNLYTLTMKTSIDYYNNYKYDLISDAPHLSRDMLMHVLRNEKYERMSKMHINYILESIITDTTLVVSTSTNIIIDNLDEMWRHYCIQNKNKKIKCIQCSNLKKYTIIRHVNILSNRIGFKYPTFSLDLTLPICIKCNKN